MSDSNAVGNTVMAQIDLTDCPLGNVLDPNEPDQRVEERFFSGWTNGLTAPPNWRMPGFFRVIDDGEAAGGADRVLEHINKTDRTLVAGHDLWTDLTIEASLRQLNAFSQPNSDDPHAHKALTGLMLRYQDLRQYYLFGFEGFGRLVLYHRKDQAWSLLADQPRGIDRGRYYRLRAECEGDQIRCFVDDELVFKARDSRLPTGKVGIRTNTRCRIHSVTVQSPEPARVAFGSRLDARDRAWAEAAEAYPQPVLWKKIDISPWWPCKVRYGDARGAGKKELILEKATGEGPRIICLDIDSSQVQSDRTYAAARGLTHTSIHDLDGCGAEDIIGLDLDADRLRMVSGRTGETTADVELPRAGPYRGWRNDSVGDWLHSLRVLWPCQLRADTCGAQDLILRDGDGAGTGYSFWAFDDQLNLQWRADAHGAWHGMYMWFCDVDGDGRDEILPGYELWDGDGKRLWTMEGAEYIEDSGGAGHIDHAAFGPISGDGGMQIGVAGSDPGFFLVDAHDGAVLRHHRYGHVQGIYAGNFRPEKPGLEMWMGDRWGTYGLLNLVDGSGDPLARMEPDNISQGGPAVNWSGTGEELLFLYTSADAFGFWDAGCRRLLRPVCEGLPFTWKPGLVEDVCGDARDEITYVHEGTVYIVTQDTPYPSGARIYKPTRRMDISVPGWAVAD
ncbi:MAG TPA: hypothetical protein DIC52_13075 [Candidatus Latescibacteria bacterium]|nr:hypothetical protein [Candidatus Latescibacterota bacterium]